MIIKSIKINKKIYYCHNKCFFNHINNMQFYNYFQVLLVLHLLIFWNISTQDLQENSDYIKWVDFKITSDVLTKVAKLDIDSHNSDSAVKYNWIEVLAYLACKNGGILKNLNEMI